MSLPAADELFRTTGGSAVQPSTPPQPGGAPRVPAPGGEHAPAADDAPSAGSPGDRAGDRPTSGRAADAGPAEHGTRSTARPARGAVPGQNSGGPNGRSGSGANGTSPGGGPTATAAGGAPVSTGAGGPNRPASGKNRQPDGAATPRRSRAARRPSGRERHDEKITVYVSAEELMDLEHARLVLRGEHGLAVDRGRIVREAVAVVLADLESRGDASILVRRLRGR
ncbi:hypothetical protein RM572_24225 [Streptomyces sp. DSM 42041]|uniref:Uncharacterized protein n=1 Tax=Streptomyces hazeniae TaxID=3075538 RepID=A0ABU2NYQ1_9ACTN|nr:hypothetical protein [Streptomyces sp. DSM 42041]MDT0381874.1 hypothetical protein [Streptomyces sp. DSM 42041]